MKERPRKERVVALHGDVYTSKTALWKAYREFDFTLRGLSDLNEFEAYLGSREVSDFLSQCEKGAPTLYYGDEELPEEFEPACELIKRLRNELANVDDSWWKGRDEERTAD